MYTRVYICNEMCYTPQLYEFVPLLVSGGPKMHSHNICVYICTFIKTKRQQPITPALLCDSLFPVPPLRVSNTYVGGGGGVATVVYSITLMLRRTTNLFRGRFDK